MSSEVQEVQGYLGKHGEILSLEKQDRRLKGVSSRKGLYYSSVRT